jgi:hypothetical protein
MEEVPVPTESINTPISATPSLPSSNTSTTPTGQTPVNPPSLLSSFMNPTNTISEIPKEEAPRKLDKLLKVDIDPAKTDRPEWIVCNLILQL